MGDSLDILTLIAGASLAALFASTGVDMLLRDSKSPSAVCRIFGIACLLAALLAASVTATAQIWHSDRSTIVYSKQEIISVRASGDPASGRNLTIVTAEGKTRFLPNAVQVDIILHADDDEKTYIDVIKERQVRTILWVEVSDRFVYRCSLSIPSSMGSIFPTGVDSIETT